MEVFIALCALLTLAQGASLNNRIVGGELAAPDQFPFIASLREVEPNKHFCGGTIIGRRTILTAAHCSIFGEEYTVVVLGTNKIDDETAKRYTIKSFITNDDYDVAVIILTEEIEFSELVRPIHLASRPMTDHERVTIAGWGKTSYPGTTPNDLHWMQANVLSHPECTALTGATQLDGVICTLERKGVGVCSGDSGGPLVNNRNEVVGVASSAYLCALGMPDYWTDVYHFKDWILANSIL